MALKETGEICALLEGAAKAIAQVRADGKLGFEDLFALSPLVDLGKEALLDADKVLSEFKGANGEDLEEGISRLVRASVSFTLEVSSLFKMVMNK